MGVFEKLPQRGIYQASHGRKLNEYLHDVDEECHERIELLVEEMKAGAGITEELKASAPVKWVGLMNNVRSAAEEAMIRELIYV